MQQWVMQKGGLFLSFVTGIDPEGPQPPPQKLKGLRSRADFEIEFIQIK